MLKINRKKGLLVGLLLLLCTFFLSTSMMLWKANADTTAEEYPQTFHIMEGAGVKIVQNTQDSGLRFGFRMPKTQFETLVDENGNFKAGVETGAYVIPTDLLGEKTIEEAVAESNSLLSRKNVVATAWYVCPKNADFMEMYVYLYKIPEASFNRNYSAVGFVNDGTGEKLSASESRSIAEVAHKAINATDSELNDDEKAFVDGYLLDYEVTFASVDKTLQTVEVKYGETVTAPNVDYGYTLKNWKQGSAVADLSAPVVKAVTYTAEYDKSNGFDLGFDNSNFVIKGSNDSSYSIADGKLNMNVGNWEYAAKIEFPETLTVTPDDVIKVKYTGANTAVKLKLASGKSIVLGPGVGNWYISSCPVGTLGEDNYGLFQLKTIFKAGGAAEETCIGVDLTASEYAITGMEFGCTGSLADYAIDYVQINKAELVNIGETNEAGETILVDFNSSNYDKFIAPADSSTASYSIANGALTYSANATWKKGLVLVLPEPVVLPESYTITVRYKGNLSMGLYNQEGKTAYCGCYQGWNEGPAMTHTTDGEWKVATFTSAALAASTNGMNWTDKKATEITRIGFYAMNTNSTIVVDSITVKAN